MNKYELHNEKQRAKFGSDFLPMPYFISPAMFDLLEKERPSALDDCMVTSYALSAAEQIILAA